MHRRIDVWRQYLIGDSIETKRHLYDRFISGRKDIPLEIRLTIQADMPRTFPRNEWVQNNIQDIQTIVTEYAAVHKADSYLQGFNFIATVILYVMKDEPKYKMADTWWCMAGVIGRVRSFIPDFNIAWSRWCQRHWMREFQAKLSRKRPTLSSILSKQQDSISRLIPCKWFLLWFVQTVVFDEIFILWDFLIQLPPEQLMKAYVTITYEIFNEQATTVSYKWANVDSTELLMDILGMKIQGIDVILNKVKKQFRL